MLSFRQFLEQVQDYDQTHKTKVVSTKQLRDGSEQTRERYFKDRNKAMDYSFNVKKKKNYSATVFSVG